MFKNRDINSAQGGTSQQPECLARTTEPESANLGKAGEANLLKKFSESELLLIEMSFSPKRQKRMFVCKFYMFSCWKSETIQRTKLQKQRLDLSPIQNFSPKLGICSLKGRIRLFMQQVKSHNPKKTGTELILSAGPRV